MTDLSASKDMEIICSAGKGVLLASDCLACSLEDGRPLCGYDYGLIRAMFKNGDRSGIHVSDLTGCIKSAFLRKTHPVPEYVHEMLARTLGTLTHGLVEENDDFADAEIAVEALGIVGRADRVYKNGRILDFKTSRWIYPQKLPYSSHALQVNIYAHLLRKMGRLVTSAAIQYIDMSGPTKCRRCKLTVRMHDGVLSCPSCGNSPNGAHLGAVLVEIPLMDERYLDELIQRRRDELQAALKTGLAPMGEPSFLCGYCAFRDICPEAQNGLGGHSLYLLPYLNRLPGADTVAGGGSCLLEPEE